MNEMDWALLDDLERAARAGGAERALARVERGADPNVGASVLTALMLGALMGHANVARAMLPRSDTSRKDHEGRAALMKACQLGRENCARSLLAASDALAQDDHGMNALMSASLHAHVGCVDLLIQANSAAASAGDREDWSAMIHALRADFFSPAARRCVEPPSPWTDLDRARGQGKSRKRTRGWMGQQMALRAGIEAAPIQGAARLWL